MTDRTDEVARRAVVIGPADYAASSGIPSYPWIGASARMYGEALAGDEMWGPGSCRVLGEDELRAADRVMGALQETADTTVPGDVLLVVYVGHGAYWGDLPGAQVHFSVGSSREHEPWTWLSSWYIYRVMRKSKASLKILIADCCYSNLLPQLGPEPVLPGVLGTPDEGTCVLTALKNSNQADAEGCPALPEHLAECTPFSGHLLNVLLHGTVDSAPRLSLGSVREAVKRDMRDCPTPGHDVPRMSLNDAPERTPLFTNRSDPALRLPSARDPVEPDQWVDALMRAPELDVSELLADPRRAGEVVARLRAEPDETSRGIAQRIDAQANARFAPRDFARYWNRVERRLRS